MICADRGRFIILVTVYAISALILVFGSFAFFSYVNLSTVWASQFSFAFLCPVVEFAAFETLVYSYIVITITHIPTNFHFVSQEFFPRFWSHFYRVRQGKRMFFK
jgi:hypothetical protein